MFYVVELHNIKINFEQKELSLTSSYLLSWQYVPVKPLSQAQVKFPPGWLIHRPWGPQTLDEMKRIPSCVALVKTSIVQLSITEKEVLSLD